MPDRRARRQPLLLMLVLTLLVLALGARVLYDSAGELLTAGDDLTRVRLPWLAAAATAEICSYLLYGLALRVLLQSGGAGNVAVLPLSAVGVASQAAAYCLPGGVAVSGAVVYRRLSRRGVDPALTGWMLAASTGLYLTALAVLALVGAELAGDGSSSVPDLRLTSVLLLGLVAGVVQLLYLFRHLRLPARSARAVATWLDGALLRLRDRPGTPVGDALDHLGRVRIARRAVVLSGGLLALVWLTDALCLALSFLTLGHAPPWQGLLLAYCAAQLAAMLPFTPGGLGVVEGSLTIALVAYGGSAQTALAAVLLYRLISFWGVLPAGAGCYAFLRWQERGTSSPAREEATVG